MTGRGEVRERKKAMDQWDYETTKSVCLEKKSKREIILI